MLLPIPLSKMDCKGLVTWPGSHGKQKNLMLTRTSASRPSAPSTASQRPPNSWGTLVSRWCNQGATPGQQ